MIRSPSPESNDGSTPKLFRAKESKDSIVRHHEWTPFIFRLSAELMIVPGAGSLCFYNFCVIAPRGPERYADPKARAYWLIGVLLCFQFWPIETNITTKEG